MLQAALLNCLFFDRFPFSENVFGTPEVDVRGSDVAQALVIAVIVVVIDKDTNRCCQTNERAHQYLVDGNFYEITKERHSVRAASRFSLNVLRFKSDLCELNRL